MEKQRFSICIVKPANYTHSLCFMEVALLLKFSLESLGFSCEVVLNSLDPDKTNIVLGSNLLRFEAGLCHCRYIIFQLEQLDSKEGWFNPEVEKIVKNAHDVWDYSETNISFLKDLNIEAKHLPIGYHEKLECIQPSSKQDIDVLFYGSLNERRQVVLNTLSQKCSVKHLFNVYGEERDHNIARSRIVLNMHYYEKQIMETVRISYLLNNKCFFVSEESEINPNRRQGVYVPYDKLVDTCMYYLEKPEERKEKALRAYGDFKKDLMTRNLQRVLV